MKIVRGEGLGGPSVKQLEESLAKLYDLRLEARELKRSGHPGARAEGIKAEAEATDHIRWVRQQMSKEDPLAEL